MSKVNLWEQYNGWMKDCRFVELSHKLSPKTPHWSGWQPLNAEVKSDFSASIFRAHLYTTVGQYGTHVDAPNHMVEQGRTLDQIGIEEMIMPLCVIDLSEKCKENSDYVLSLQDINDWEEINGNIPEGAFVAFRSDWSKLPADEMDRLDSHGNRHFPGWSLASIQFLVEQRGISSIGHETSDTEAPITSGTTDYEVEYYILSKNRIQAELLVNLDQCPPTGALIFCTFPLVENGTGFPARCFAICPKE